MYNMQGWKHENEYARAPFKDDHEPQFTCNIKISKDHILPLKLRILACITKCSLNFLHSQTKLSCKMGVVSCGRKGKIDSCPDELIFEMPYTSIWNSCSLILFLGSSFSGFPLFNSAGGFSGLFLLHFLETEKTIKRKKHQKKKNLLL